MSRISRRVTALPIKVKILLGSCCVLAILVTVAGLGYWRFLGVADSFRTYVQRVDVVGISRDIDRDFGDLRRHVREFVLTGNPDEAKSAIQTAEQVKAGIARGMSVVLNPERRRHLEQTSARFGAYRQGVDAVFDLRRSRDAIVRNTLDPDGTRAREEFTDLITSADRREDAGMAKLSQQGMQALMILRLNANKVIDRQLDEVAVQKAEAAAAEIGKLMPMLVKAGGGAIEQKLLDSVRQHVETYVTAYRQAVRISGDLDKRLNGIMKQDADSIAADLAAIAASAVAEQRAIESGTLAAIATTQGMQLALAAGGLVLGLVASWLIGAGISRPVRHMTEVMHRLAAGELEVEIPALERSDEVGQMAQAMLVFRENAVEAKRLQGEADRVRVAKDRRQAAMDEHTQDFGTSTAGVMATLLRSAETMRTTADEMSQAAHRTRDVAAETADNAAVSAQNLSAVAAAAEEMSASIHEISQQVARATEATQEAVARAAATDTKVAGMATAAERVGDVVRLISAIAGQTNLLALNATIEAARAGDAGKGFAVVAGEVKALAAQTAKATDEIATQIGAIRTATGEAVAAVRDVSTAISQVSEVAAAIAAAVEQQTATTREIATSVQTVTTATQDATKAMRDVTAVSETAESASQNVLQNATEVGNTADVLRSELTVFLAAMAKTEEDDRRRYERIPGQGTTAVLRVAGQAPRRVIIVNVSRGGMAVQTDWWSDAGTQVQVELPGISDAVIGRTVRTHDGILALAFRQDEAMLKLVDKALTHIADLDKTAAAA